MYNRIVCNFGGYEQSCQPPHTISITASKYMLPFACT